MRKWLSRILDWLRRLEWMVSLQEWVVNSSSWEWWVGGGATVIAAVALIKSEWILVAGIAVGVSCLLMGLRQRRKGPDAGPLTPNDSDPSFDMSIRAVINYLAETVPHSFDRSSLSDRAAFKKLHELMCSGALPVVGATETFGVRQRISPEKCFELTQEEQVVPLNPASPEGFRFCLTSYADKNWEHDWDGKTQPEILEQYTDLRVRSEDVYRLWPKATP